jgi:hypothetical protein
MLRINIVGDINDGVNIHKEFTTEELLYFNVESTTIHKILDKLNKLHSKVKVYESIELKEYESIINEIDKEGDLKDIIYFLIPKYEDNLIHTLKKFELINTNVGIDYETEYGTYYVFNKIDNVNIYSFLKNNILPLNIIDYEDFKNKFYDIFYNLSDEEKCKLLNVNTEEELSDIIYNEDEEVIDRILPYYYNDKGESPIYINNVEFFETIKK